MDFIADKVIKFRGWIIGFFTILTIIMVCCFLKVKINYNMQDYLPENANSTKAIEIMSKNFSDSISNANVLIPNVTIMEALEYKDKLSNIEGVEDVGWLDKAIDLNTLSQMTLSDGTLATEMLDENIKTTLESYYKDKNALFQVTVKNGAEQDTVNAIYDLIGEDSAMNGSAVEQAVNQNMALEQSINAIMMLAPLIIIILILSTTSWIEPFLYLTTIGTAALIGLGMNIVRGEISYVTLAVAPLLQLAVSLDYAVFLSHSFDKYRKQKFEPKEAMKKAMKDSLKSISASCLTTLFGFIALLFMDFKIGPDMGISLVVGVLLSFIAVLTLLPALILCTYKLNDKCKHKPFLPEFKGLSNILVKLRIPALIIIVCVMVGAFMIQDNNTYIYGSGEPNPESRLAKDNTKIESVFGKNNIMAILVPVGNKNAEANIGERLEKLDYVDNVMSYASTIGFEVPEEYLPKGTKENFYSDKYARIIINTTLESEGEEAFKAVDEVKNIVYEYYDEDDIYMCGNTVNMYDMKTTVENDNKTVSLITVIAIFIILLIEFKSLIIPLLLILSVKGSIWITMGMSAITGEAICYIGYLVVSTVMMGATIDYSILITDNYIKARKRLHAKNAMKETLMSSIKSILVSAATLAIAGFALGLSSSEGLVRLLGLMLGKGTVVAFVVSITFLPAILLLFDKLLPKLSLGLKFLKKNEKEQILEETEKSENSSLSKRRVICINREYGSGGHEIGKRVAEELGIKFVDKSFIDNAEKELGISKEILERADEKLKNKLLYTSLYEGNNEKYYGMSANEILFEFERQIIEKEVTKGDCVIVGRCAGEFLSKNTNARVVNIFISAKLEDRIKRKMELDKKSKDEVISDIKKNDKSRLEYYKFHTGLNWRDPSNYACILNTSLLGIERTIAVLCEAYNKMNDED